MGKDKEEDSDDDVPPLIITRKEWKARKPKTSKRFAKPVADVIYTETDSRECKNIEDCTRLVQEIQNYHMNIRDLSDIQFHFLIGPDGIVFEGRGWDTRGIKYDDKDTMPMHLSEKSLEIAFIGKYKDKEPPEQMIHTAQNLLKLGINKKKVTQRSTTKADKEEEDEDIRSLNLTPDEKKRLQKITIK